MKQLRVTVGLLLLVALLVTSSSIAFADQPDCAKSWLHSHTLELDPGFWSVGPHDYEFSVSWSGGKEDFFIAFDVTPDAPEVPGQVIMRILAITSEEGELIEIHPDEDTALQVSWGWIDDQGNPLSRNEAEAEREQVEVRIRLDGDDWIDLPAGPLVKRCAWQNPGHFRRSWGPSY